MSSFLTQLQQECADRIVSDPLFANAPVITEKIKDILGSIAVALGPITKTGGKSGLCIVLITPVANVNFANLSGPYFDDVRIMARVLENVTVNKSPSGTNIDALEAIEKVCFLLHQFYPANASSPVIAQSPTITLGDDPKNLSYDGHFKVSGGLTQVLPQIATPVLTNNAGTISAVCATPGAAIFYTVDGKNPVPRVGTFYAAPFIPGAGRTIKARAWLAGYLASEPAILNT